MRIDDQSEERAAYHEAGHAVVAAACAFRVTEVSIVPSEGSHGHTHFVLPAAGAGASMLELLVAAAGSAGEHRYHEAIQDTGAKPEGTRRDRIRALVLLKELGLPAILYRAFVVTAHEILSRGDRLDSFEALAKALKSMKTLAGSALEELTESIPPVTSDEIRVLLLAAERLPFPLR